MPCTRCWRSPAKHYSESYLSTLLKSPKHQGQTSFQETMEPLKIRITGESSIARLAEQGVLRLTVTSEGPELATVSTEVISRSNTLTELFKTLYPKADDDTATADAAVTKFASTFLRTRSYTPRDKDKQPLPKVYQASMALGIVFRDITKLSQVVGQLVTYSNVCINSIDWSLTKATQDALYSRVRREAIRNAVNKANDYAREVGREVYPVDIMESGGSAVVQQHARGSSFGFGAQHRLYTMREVGGSGGFVGLTPSHAPGLFETLDLSPPDIQVTASVNAKFQSVPAK